MGLEQCMLVRFSKKTGKIDTTLECVGNAMLRLWALQNTEPSKECLIFSRVTGKILYRVVGRKDNFPRMDESTKGDLGNISDYCEDFLDVLGVQ